MHQYGLLLRLKLRNVAVAEDLDLADAAFRRLNRGINSAIGIRDGTSNIDLVIGAVPERPPMALVMVIHVHDRGVMVCRFRPRDSLEASADRRHTSARIGSHLDRRGARSRIDLKPNVVSGVAGWVDG